MKVLETASSLNNKIVVEAYKKEGLRAEVKSGFAHLSQKVSSKGLKVLLDARLNDGTVIPKGSMAYFREEMLHTAPWATKSLESDAVEGAFLVADIGHVDFIVPPKGE